MEVQVASVGKRRVDDVKTCDEIDGDKRQTKARLGSTQERGQKVRTHASEHLNLRRRTSLGARWRHGRLADGAQEAIECISPRL